VIDDEQHKTRTHESGHATVSYLLGLRNQGPITVVPRGRYLGLCGTGCLPITDDALRQLGRRVVTLPTRLRRPVETWVMATLAGDIAQDLYGPASPDTPEPAPEQTPDPDHAAELIAALPAAQAAAINDTAEAATLLTDQEHVMATLKALHDPDREIAAAHARYLAAETAALLLTDRASRMVIALAAELESRPVMSSRQWRAVLRAA
jgi:hypothetical protein